MASLYLGDNAGPGEVQVFTLPSLRLVETISPPIWRRRVALGADAIPGGPLFVLTGARLNDAIWTFARSKRNPDEFVSVPDGFLGGRQTGLNEVATDVRVGP